MFIYCYNNTTCWDARPQALCICIRQIPPCCAVTLHPASDKPACEQQGLIYLVLGYWVVPDWLEEKLQHWEDPIIKVTQKWFLNIVILLLNRIITGKQVFHMECMECIRIAFLYC